MTVEERRAEAARLRMRGLTEAQIGERLGVSQGTVSTYLNPRTSPHGPVAATCHRAAATKRQRDEELVVLKPAKVCECERPATYTEADGELRCLCGRAARVQLGLAA